MTDLQLVIMRILWTHEEASTAYVQAALRPAHKLAATTVSTMLARMAKRGDITMRRDGRQFLYSAKITEEDIASRKLTEVADLLYSGSSVAAISHLIDAGQLDAAELRELRKKIVEKEESVAHNRRRQ